MTQKDYNLILAIEQEGLTNCDFSLLRDIYNTRDSLGTTQQLSLEGRWLAVYRSRDDNQFLTANISPSECVELHPQHILNFENEELYDGESLLLFQFDNN